LFEQSTRKCKWKSYDGQAKFLDEIKVKQVTARKFGYGPQFVDLFVKQHIKKMREFARQRGFCNPVGVRFDKLVGDIEDGRGGEDKEGGKGGSNSTNAGLERPCCCVVCQ
jgi:hypothetical protein